MNNYNNNGRNVHNNMQNRGTNTQGQNIRGQNMQGQNVQRQQQECKASGTNVRPDAESMSGLLNAVSRKLNISPDQLRRELEQGKFDNALKNMSPQDAEKFSAAIKQPKIIEQMMSTPQAQALYKKLSGGK